MVAPIFCACLVTWPTVLADKPTADLVRLFSFLTRSCVVGVKVIGLGLGFVFFVKSSAPVVIWLASHPEPVTIKREATAAFWTRLESL